MTPTDAALLEAAKCQLYRIRKENTRLKRELLIAQTDAAHYQEAALAWKEEARVLRLANKEKFQ